MKYLKIFFLLVITNLCSRWAFAQANHVYMTLTPAAGYPDPSVKPGIIMVQPQEKSITPEEHVTYEAKTVMPSATLSIGKASIVPAPTRENSTSSVEKEKVKVNYSEQKVGKQETPANNPSLIPK